MKRKQVELASLQALLHAHSQMFVDRRAVSEIEQQLLMAEGAPAEARPSPRRASAGSRRPERRQAAHEARSQEEPRLCADRRSPGGWTWSGRGRSERGGAGAATPPRSGPATPCFFEAALDGGGGERDLEAMMGCVEYWSAAAT